MNIYSKKQKWKWLLLIAATCIVASSLWVSSHLVHKISISEKRNVELWAEAVKRKALMKEATYQLYAKIKREEKKKVKNQLLDICKSIPALAVFMLPGGALLLPLLIKLIPDILPSAFKEDSKDIDLN